MHLMVSRITQFYTEERFFRIKDNAGNIQTGSLSNKMMFKTKETEIINNGNTFVKKEVFIPEFDIKVKIIDEKPTDRNYYINTAFNMFQIGGITIPDIWYTLEEGKFPPKEDILAHLEANNIGLQIASLLQNLPPEQQQMISEQIIQQVQIMVQGTQPPVEGQQPQQQEQIQEESEGMF